MVREIKVRERPDLHQVVVACKFRTAASYSSNLIAPADHMITASTEHDVDSDACCSFVGFLT